MRGNNSLVAAALCTARVRKGSPALCVSNVHQQFAEASCSHVSELSMLYLVVTTVRFRRFSCPTTFRLTATVSATASMSCAMPIHATLVPYRELPGLTHALVPVGAADRVQIRGWGNSLYCPLSVL